MIPPFFDGVQLSGRNKKSSPYDSGDMTLNYQVQNFKKLQDGLTLKYISSTLQNKINVVIKL
jgi:hypothetical protein